MAGMDTTRSPRRERASAYGAAALVLAAAFSVPGAVTAAGPGSVVPSPPEPTGPYAVGRTELQLVDPDRGHPWVEEAAERDLMVSIWYPAGTGGDPAPYVTPSVAETLGNELEQGGLHRGAVDLASARAHARLDADVAGGGPFPVVLFSPGFHVSRFLNTSNAEELASRGYVVAAMDHPYETSAVDFPDGRVLRTNTPARSTEMYREAVAVRVADTRTVLDGLAELAGGGLPDAGGRALPEGLGEALDLEAVGMLGHSAGGFTTAEAMLEDDRIDAGMNLDGSLAHHVGDGVWGDSTLRGVDRPFAILTAGLTGSPRVPHTSEHSRDLAMFVEASPRVLELYMAAGDHMSYTDHQWLIPAVAEVHHPGSGAWHEMVENAIRTVDPAESVRTQRAYITAFFDVHLRGEAAPLLEGPSPDFPEMEFIGSG